ncbi:MAG: hypothetical protein IT349_14920 [Candidatus Eisenbacteria bacterium]|nr:hypothetical protein [Candidatus Eisenbacteria bacterium]
MLRHEITSELAAHRGYLRRSLVFLVLGILAVRFGGLFGREIGVSLLVWHGLLAFTQPIFSMLGRERRDQRDGLAPGEARAVRSLARLFALLIVTLPSTIVLAVFFLGRVGRDAFLTPLAASVGLLIGGVLLVLVSLAAVVFLTRSIAAVALAYAAIVVLVALGSTEVGLSLIPWVGFWLALSTGTPWGFSIIFLTQVTWACMVAMLVYEALLARSPDPESRAAEPSLPAALDPAARPSEAAPPPPIDS